jgi:Spy/CpxP family protein refolding chaperone
MNHRVSSLWRPAALLAVLIALAPATVLGQGKWWQSERFQRDLQLTAEQIARIEEVFQASLPELRQQKHELDRLETQLSRLIDTSADEDAVMTEADRVEKVRTGLSKCRTRMLVRIRRVLTPEQRAKLAELHQEWERDRKGRHDRRDPE